MTSQSEGVILPEDRDPSSGIGPLSGFRPDVQALRGLAVLLVVMFHARFIFHGGFIGVDVFFVVSGFVIGRGLVGGFVSTNTMSFRAFYRRRVRRILPALAVMLSVVILVAPLLAPLAASPYTTKTGIAAALFSANAYLFQVFNLGYFASSAELNPLLHTWSLSVEEQFYFIFPAMMWFAWRIAVKRRRSIPVLRIFVAGLIIVSLGLCVWLSSASGISRGEIFAFYSPFTRAWEFAVGLALVLLPASWARVRGAQPIALVSGLSMIGFSALAFSDTTLFPGVAAVVPVVGAALVIFAGSGGNSDSKRNSALWPMIRLGDVSYSWYLWHWPFIVFAGAFWPLSGSLPLVVAAVASLLPAWFSYRFIEQRATKETRRQSAAVALAAICILAPLISAAMSVPIQRVISRQPAVIDVAQSIKPVPECSARVNDRCFWGDPGSSGSVVLAGDSNAGHYSTALIGASAASGYQLATSTRPGCPPLGLAFTLFPQKSKAVECSRQMNALIDELILERPDLVVLAARTPPYLVAGRMFVDDQEIIDPMERAREFEDGLTDALRRLTSAGIRAAVIATAPAPNGERWTPDTCSALLLMLDSTRCSPKFAQSDYPAILSANELERRAARASGAEFWDFSPEICPQGFCTAVGRGFYPWKDEGHISEPMSKALTSRAQEFIDGAAR